MSGVTLRSPEASAVGQAGRETTATVLGDLSLLLLKKPLITARAHGGSSALWRAVGAIARSQLLPGGRMAHLLARASDICALARL